MRALLLAALLGLAVAQQAAVVTRTEELVGVPGVRAETFDIRQGDHVVGTIQHFEARSGGGNAGPELLPGAALIVLGRRGGPLGLPSAHAGSLSELLRQQLSALDQAAQGRVAFAVPGSRGVAVLCRKRLEALLKAAAAAAAAQEQAGPSQSGGAGLPAVGTQPGGAGRLFGGAEEVPGEGGEAERHHHHKHSHKHSHKGWKAWKHHKEHAEHEEEHRQKREHHEHGGHDRHAAHTEDEQAGAQHWAPHPRHGGKGPEPHGSRPPFDPEHEHEHGHWHGPFPFPWWHPGHAHGHGGHEQEHGEWAHHHHWGHWGHHWGHHEGEHEHEHPGHGWWHRHWPRHWHWPWSHGRSHPRHHGWHAGDASAQDYEEQAGPGSFVAGLQAALARMHAAAAAAAAPTPARTTQQQPTAVARPVPQQWAESWGLPWVELHEGGEPLPEADPIDWSLRLEDGTLNWGAIAFFCWALMAGLIWLTLLASCIRCVGRRACRGRRCCRGRPAPNPQFVVAKGEGDVLAPLLPEGPIKGAVEYAGDHMTPGSKAVHVITYSAAPTKGAEQL